MRYTSTRNKNISLRGSQCILKGISEDGGLFVPEYFPQIDISELIDLDYRSLALFILGEFFPEIEKETLKMATNQAYDRKFSSNEIIKQENIMGVNFLQLYHGPTLAFKDMALSILPYLLNISKEIENIKEEIVILTATSGDTGNAALEGFASIKDTSIIVFFPEEGVSQVQKLQMISQEGDNTLVAGIKGNFDDAQNGVKYIFNDEDFKSKLKEDSYILSSANSINIGRLIPQIVYYIYSYGKMVKNDEIDLGEKINIVVPTGNFGNILAGYYARNMGLPINKLICASNDNNVLTEFLNTGQYNIKRELKLTSSPSMDILISSNLERLLFHLRNDDKLIRDKMGDLSTKRQYEMDNLNVKDFYANFANEDEISQAIKEVFEKENYLMDPHTAVAYCVYEKYKEESKDNSKTIIASTASPFKFGEKVASSIGINISNKNEFEILGELSERSGIDIPASIENLRGKKINHRNIIDKGNMANIIEDFLKEGDRND